MVMENNPLQSWKLFMEKMCRRVFPLLLTILHCHPGWRSSMWQVECFFAFNIVKDISGNLSLHRALAAVHNTQWCDLRDLCLYVSITTFNYELSAPVCVYCVVELAYFVNRCIIRLLFLF